LLKGESAASTRIIVENTDEKRARGPFNISKGATDEIISDLMQEAPLDFMRMFTWPLFQSGSGHNPDLEVKSQPKGHATKNEES
jgi:hypothetical protein